MCFQSRDIVFVVFEGRKEWLSEQRNNTGCAVNGRAKGILTRKQVVADSVNEWHRDAATRIEARSVCGGAIGL